MLPRERRVRQNLYAGLLLIAAGVVLGGCVETADLLDTALMNPVLKEDFENPAVEHPLTFLPGHKLVTGTAAWDVMAGQLELFNAQNHPETPAFDGKQAVRLTGTVEPGLLAVSFPTIAKRQYTLTFHYAHQALPDVPQSRARVEVIGAGTTLLEAEYGPDDPTFRNYRRYSGNFSADQDRTTLRFTAPKGASGITLDGIVVLTVPPPLPIPPPPQVR